MNVTTVSFVFQLVFFLNDLYFVPGMKNISEVNNIGKMLEEGQNS